MSTRAFRIALLIGILALFGVLGARTAMATSTDRVDLLLALGTHTGFTLLCWADARAIKKPVTHAFLWVTFFAWPILVPGYLLWSRGLRGLGLTLLLALLIILSVLVPFFITDYVLYNA